MGGPLRCPIGDVLGQLLEPDRVVLDVLVVDQVVTLLVADSLPFGNGPLINLSLPFSAGFAFADSSGDASISEFLPSSLAGQPLFFQAVELPTGRLSNVVRVTLP